MARKTTISREGLEFLIGAVKNTINIGDIINNEDLADNKTYSNIKIQEELEDLETEINELFTSVTTETNDRVTTLETRVNDLFQSVSDGKTLVANAITGKGVSTATDATFATMATNVGKITNYTASEKQALATAITNKGVSTSSTASFATMATNIGKISGGYKEETISKTFSTTGTSVLTVTFSANVLAIKQIVAPSNSCSIVLQSSKNIYTINGKELTVHVIGGGTWSFTALIQN